MKLELNIAPNIGTIIDAWLQLIRLEIKVVENSTTLFICVDSLLVILKYWYSFRLICQIVEYLPVVETLPV